MAVELRRRLVRLALTRHLVRKALMRALIGMRGNMLLHLEILLLRNHARMHSHLAASVLLMSLVIDVLCLIIALVLQLLLGMLILLWVSALPLQTIRRRLRGVPHLDLSNHCWSHVLWLLRLSHLLWVDISLRHRLILSDLYREVEA